MLVTVWIFVFLIKIQVAILSCYQPFFVLIAALNPCPSGYYGSKIFAYFY